MMDISIRAQPHAVRRARLEEGSHYLVRGVWCGPSEVQEAAQPGSVLAALADDSRFSSQVGERTLWARLGAPWAEEAWLSADSFSLLGVADDWRLQIWAADVGPVVVFEDPVIDTVWPLDRGRGGGGVLDAFRVLDVENGVAVSRFFRDFGTPPEIGFEAGDASDGAPGITRWLPVARLRQLQERLHASMQAQSTGWPFGADVGGAGAQFGVMGAVGEADLRLKVSLWGAVALAAAGAIREGRIAFCEAPDPDTDASCGKWFVQQRSTRIYCSETCRTRVSSRHWHAKEKGKRQ